MVRHPAPRFLATCLTVLALAASGLPGCGTSDDGGTAPPPPGDTTIGPGGGTLISDDGAATMVVPPGALDSEVALTATPAASPPAGALAGTAYDLGPDGTLFDVPVTLTFAYDPAALPQDAWHADLRLCRHAAAAWIPLADSVVDSTAHTVSATTTHLSTYGVAVDEGGEVATRTAYLKDDPDDTAEDEFATLAAALAWLDAELGYEDLGVLVWQTSTPQPAERLAFTFDLAIEVEAGHTAVITGPASGPLTIDAVGAIALSGFNISAAGGLVLNANRNVTVGECVLPDETTVNIGGVVSARFPAVEPGYAAKSAAAQKRAKGSTIFANQLEILNVNLAGGGTIEGDHSLEGNTVQRLNVGGPGILGGLSELKVSALPGPGGPIPIPYPNFSVNMSGSSKLVCKKITSVENLQLRANMSGDNEVELEDVAGNAADLRLEGGGSARFKMLRGNMASATAYFAVWSMDVRIEGQSAVRHLDLTCAGNTAVVIMNGGRFEEKVDIRAEQVAGQVSVDSTDDTFEGDTDISLPAGGDATVSITGATLQGARLSIGPPAPKDRAGHAAVPATRGGVTLTDIAWTGSIATDHIDITGIDGPVSISGGTISNPSSVGVNLGLTEVGGSISIDGVALTGGGIGLVDCTGAATIADCNLTVTAGYGIGLGSCAGVTLQNTQINLAGGSSAVQTYEMSGAVTISGCSIDASTGATALTFQGTTASVTGCSPIAGMVLISESSIHLSDNTFSGAMIMDDLVTSPGLENDPVADNDGLLPGMVFTHRDWDGNGCCDYPPEWNVQDEHGNCAVCTGQ